MIAEYNPPVGYYDTPYWQTFDIAALAATVANAGATLFQANVIPVSGRAEFFILRQLIFSGFSATGIRIYDALSRAASNDLRGISGGAGTQGNQDNCPILPICPEKAYPRSSNIRFDIQNITPQANGTGINAVPLARLYFRGVQRRLGADPQPRALNGRSEESYTYRLDINVNWFYFNGGLAANGVSGNQRFLIPITGWDFELLDVGVVGDEWQVPSPTNGGTARMLLYDYQYTPMSGQPLGLGAFNQLNQLQNNTTQTGPPQGNGSICPSLIYPDQSVIQFDIQSLLSPTDIASNTITLLFHGKRRYRK